MQQVRRRAPGRAPAPVVAGGGRDIRVPGELLHGGDARASVENVIHVGAPGLSGEAVAQGVGGGLGPAVRADLRVEVGDMPLHGARAEGERVDYG